MALKPSEFARLELVAAYIAEIGLSTIHLTAPAAAPDSICVEMSDGLRSDAQRTDASIVVLDAFVFDSAGHAEIVLNGVKDMVPFGDLDTARKCITDAASEAGATWRTKAQVLNDVSSEIDGITFQLRAYKESGGLKTFNAAYKKYRNLCMATTQPAMQYSAYLHQYTLKIVTLVASNIAAGRDRFANLARLSPDPLPNIQRREHFPEDQDVGRWPTSGRSSVAEPLPGWSPRAPAHRRGW